MTSRVLLVPDVHFWCWWHQSLAIQKHAPPEYAVEVVVQQELQARKEETDWLRGFDAVLHWSWIDCPFLFGIRRLVTVVAHDGLKWHHVRDETGRAWLIEMRQWAGASPQRNFGNARKILPRADHVICVNPDLEAFVRDKVRQQGVTYLPAGVDHHAFAPMTPLWDGRCPLRIGWCGQEGGRTKGYDWIMEPLMERMGGKVEFVVNRRSHLDAFTQAEMADWYNSVDVFLCTSISEGTPAPCLEAMASGRGVLTTPVGDMPGVLGGTEAGVLVPAYINDDQRVRTVEHFTEQIESLTPERVQRMGAAARARIEQAYTWEYLAPLWLEAIAG